MARFDELKREIAELEAQQSTEEPAAHTQEEKVEANRLMIRRIFTAMLCYCDDHIICKFHQDNWHLGA